MTIHTKIAISKVYNYTHNTSLYKNFFFLVFIVLIVTTFTVLPRLRINIGDESSNFKKITLVNIRNLPEFRLVGDSASPRNPECTHWDCFNIYKCGRTGHDRIAVYVYPPKKYVDEQGVPATELMSKEYLALLQAVVNSKYYTANPHEACIFIPSIDTLNQERLRPNLTSKALRSLPFWNDGENHLIFNMIAGNAPDFSPVVDLATGKALIAGADFNKYSFRTNFDVSIPLFSPIARPGDINHRRRSWLVTSSQLNLDVNYLGVLQKLSSRHNSLLILDACHRHNYTKRCRENSNEMVDYPAILHESTFCLVFRGERIGQFALLEAMAANCIPVVVMDGAVLPFSNVIDWKRAAVFIMENYLHTLVDVLEKISPQRIKQMQKTGRFLYDSYFSSIEKIALTTLDIIQDRVYPHWSKIYDDWNLRPEEKNTNPLFLPLTAPKSHGFTAVILTYDRVDSLYTLIDRLSRVPSLMKVIVVWNNQKKSPPPLSSFPQIQKPVKVIRTSANKLSNRFYPYNEIETEAILHIDDDIVMLTADEVEFGYEVWREFPDRIVGFPSRTHRWDNATNSWKYESEWTNEISMVLTGAAFLHKYWSFLYTTAMPANIRELVDEHMNCEDIAMNFLVANVTNKPPIKVTPRKKFKCPECVNNEMLSADEGHMIERSQCVDRFVKAFGRMPLKSVEFRADPVLFKDPFPEKLKRFNDIGSL
ncbi:exostosin-2 [Tribolium castaneum]|uniref:Exostosin-2 n=1 Tax=Tribolium castaneum TaxID=7070 RepID=D6WCJ9_TRICA|nr:PREDICTED: exostosin-2 [Tribolium castaneum]EEZ99036.1 Exostosin-2-like Protein [Tribolium castaneum]|eukprot:XP_976077.1 PREDICTED: exostosin-2 [Tribolium castaneum]